MSRVDGPIEPPATIGVLGGGQLGRYAVIAARTAGYGTIVLDPDANAPAGAVADLHLVAAYDDPAALDELAQRSAVVTTEFENPPAAALQRLAREVAVAPPVRAVAIAQDRIAEKAFLERSGFPIAPCAALVDETDLRIVAALGGPLIVKTARLGYDGKGQVPINDSADIGAAWTELGGVPCLVERRVPLDVEVSVVLARGVNGASVVYPVTENVHRQGILDLSVVPARIDASADVEAQALATRIADALDYVGVLAVEMFVSNGQLLVNELAPRPHNSGHWTLERRGNEPVRPTGSLGDSECPRECGDDVTSGGDGQPARRPLDQRQRRRRRAVLDRSARRGEVPGCICTARAAHVLDARWVT